MSYKPASKESIQKLYENMGSNFLLFTPSLCNLVDIDERLEQVDETEFVDEDNINKLRLWKELIKLNIASLIINLDISTFLRADFRSASTIEQRCNLKYVNVINIEGYKYFFGIKKKDKANSVWLKFKNIAEQIDDKDLNIDIINVETQSKKFRNNYAKSIDIDSRNFSVHYDKDPIKVYENIKQLNNEDIEAQRASAFLAILESMSAIINQYMKKYIATLKIFLKSTTPYDLSIREIFNSFPDKDNRIFTALNDKINSFGKSLDEIFASYNKPELIANKFDLGKRFTEKFNFILKSIHPGLHIHFIYLDLACALRAYFSSEFYIEKQMNLRRLRIIIYEGFRHLYGFEEEQKAHSFWKENIFNILEGSTDANIIYKLTTTEEKLKELCEYRDIKDEIKREYSVHYRYKERDNIIPIFHQLIDSNPRLEIDKSLQLLRLLPTILELNSLSIKAVYDIENCKVQSEDNEIQKKINNIIGIIETSDTEDVTKKKMIADISNLNKLLRK